MHDSTLDPLNAFAIEPLDAFDAFDREPLDEFAREPLEVSRPETGVHHPRFVRSSGSIRPDVYSAGRRRGRAAAIVIASILAIGTVAALLIFQRQAAYVWTLIGPTPQPTSIAEIETPPELPPVAAAPLPKADPLPPPAVVDDAPIPPAPSTPQAEPSRVLVTPQKEPPPALAPRAAVTPSAATASASRPTSAPASAPASTPPPSVASVPPAVSSPTPPPAAASSLAAVSSPTTSAAPPPTTAPAATTASAPTAPPPTVAAPPTNTAALAPSPAPAPAPTPRAAATPSAAAPPAAASTIDANTRGIENTLATYRNAFNALDAGAARQVWPTVNEPALNRAFERLERQEVLFDDCQIAVNNDRAEATCDGIARYVPRVGSRTPRVDRRQWKFSLVKVRDAWMIGALEVR